MSVEDLSERAVDQLVDETLARLHHLRDLHAAHHLPIWPSADVRTAATQVVARLTAEPTRDRTARIVLSTLWNTDDTHHIPTGWWTTPLGQLLLDSGPTEQPQQRPPAPAAPAVARLPSSPREHI